MNARYISITELKPKPSPKLLSCFHKIGIQTVGDLLTYPPKKFRNLTHIYQISELPSLESGQVVVLEATITSCTIKRLRRRSLILGDISFHDNSGSLHIQIFNQKLLLESLKVGEIYAITGVWKPHTKQPLQNINFERIKPGKVLLHSHRLVPVYPETAGLTSKMIRYRIHLARKQFPHVNETLPESIIQSYRILPLKQTIAALHAPQTIDQIHQAKHRLIFEEAFILQVYLQKQRLLFQSKYAPAMNQHPEILNSIITTLPYTLTKAQTRSLNEIITDLQKPLPMNRLLEGDVGTGKTLVALLSVLYTHQHTYQSVIMAPTEILAIQHFESITKLVQSLGQNITIGLITGKEHRVSTEPALGHWMTISTKEQQKMIQAGSIHCIVGTHSLIATPLTYKNLALSIVDEQHRFGVKQRAQLQNMISQAGHTVATHLLSMTATPIPRTLALSIYGDLDISLLDEYPSGRKTIKTKVVPHSKRKEAYEFIQKHIQQGRQVFFVCPKIDDTPDSEVKSVNTVYTELSTHIFPNLEIRMLHGKLKPSQKEQILKDFQSNSFPILVATSVIEVGIDIPNATIIVIEGAERFGLAQLHQFRGRVGRGNHQSFCFLFETGNQETTLNKRLKAIESASNGFELAEQDLKLRGPGQFIGHTQSGLSDFGMIALTDPDLIHQTRTLASKILNQDPTLNTYPELKERLSHFEETVHFE